MHTMDQHLADLVKAGRISYETGLEKCHHAEDFNRLTGRFGSAAPMAQGGSPAQNAPYESSSYPPVAPPAPYGHPGSTH